MTPQPEPAKPMGFEEWWKLGTHGWSSDDSAECTLAKEAWQAATAAQAQEIAILKEEQKALQIWSNAWEIRAGERFDEIALLRGSNGVTREALQQAEAECVSLRKTIEELVAAGNRCIFRENVYGLAKDVEHWRVAVEKATKGKL